MAGVEIYERALAALLQDHENGLTEADISVKLQLDQTTTRALLVHAQTRGFVDLDLDTQRYTSSLGVDLPSFESELALATGTRSTRKHALWFVGAAAVALITVSLLASISSTPTASGGTERPEPVHSDPIEEHVRASAVARENASLRRELDGILKASATIRQAAEDASCEDSWQTGTSCYIHGRLMTRGQWKTELGELDLRRTQIEIALERRRP